MQSRFQKGNRLTLTQTASTVIDLFDRSGG